MWEASECEIKRDPPDKDFPKGYVYARQGATLGETLIQLGDTYDGSGADWDFVAHARADVPWLLDQLRESRERARDLSETAACFICGGLGCVDGPGAPSVDGHPRMVSCVCGDGTAQGLAAYYERQISGLRARADAAEADTARLDWLEDRVIDAQGKRFMIADEATGGIIEIETWGAREVRELLDAARSSSSAPSGSNGGDSV